MTPKSQTQHVVSNPTRGDEAARSLERAHAIGLRNFLDEVAHNIAWLQEKGWNVRLAFRGHTPVLQSITRTKTTTEEL